jgi:hypothetical protein
MSGVGSSCGLQGAPTAVLTGLLDAGSLNTAAAWVQSLATSNEVKQSLQNWQ